jgi:type II secretory pathway predicted ATPase ExeA
MAVSNVTGSENDEPPGPASHMNADSPGPQPDSGSPGKYEPHFGLREPPFTLTANTRFTFDSRAYAGVVETIVRALERHEPLLVITGPPGSGKTLVCRTVADWRNSRTFVALVSTPPANANDLLRLVLDQFGVLPRDSRRSAEATQFELVRTLEQFLASLGSLGARAVILVDDAHRLSNEVFEGLRSLINFETETKKLLQLVLLGEPRLGALLSDPELTQLNQRVTRRYLLGPLLPEEVAGYIEHRLSVAHGEPVPLARLFSDEAVGTIRTLSSGVPRVINLLCDRALEVSHTTGVSPVSADGVLAAARSLNLAIPPSVYLKRHRIKLAAAAVVLLVASPLGYWMYLRARGDQLLPASRQSTVDSRQPTVLPAPKAAAAPSAAPPGPPVAAPPDPVLAPKLQGRATAQTPSGSSGNSGFVIIASSFRTDARANALSAQVSGLGLPVQVRSASGWYQVVVGPYATRAEAERARGQLARIDVAEAVIVAAGSTAAPQPETPSSPAPRPASPPSPVVADRPAPPGRATAAAPPPATPIPPQGRATVLDRARSLAQAADVRALMQLRQAAESQLVREGRSPADVEKLMEEIDVLLENARKRRLELDAKSFGATK